MATPKMSQLNLRSLVHILAFNGSAGQGAVLAFHWKMAEAIIITPAKVKTKVLCSDKATSQGAVDTKPAKAAPIPRVTKRAGKAQQTSVPKLVNKLSEGATV